MRLLLLAALAGGTLFATSATAQSFFPNQYVSISGGYAGSSEHSLDFPENTGSQTNELDAAPAFQLAFGNQSGDVRLEGAFGYRKHDATAKFDFGPTLIIPDDTAGEFAVRSIDLNIFYDLPTGMAWRPYVGAGIGLASVKLKDATVDDEGSTLQMQAMAGASYAVTPRTAVFVEGRFQRVGNLEIETRTINPETKAVTARLDEEFDISNAAAFAGIRFGF